MVVNITTKEKPDFLVNPHAYLQGFDDEYIAHTNLDTGFHLTRPFLDKIEIFASPKMTDEEKHRLFNLDELNKADFLSVTENKKNNTQKSKYKKHYQIMFDDGRTQLELFFENQDVKNINSYKYRFMKLVFNPWKSGVSGIEKIRKFYNTILPSDDFDKMLLAKASIGSIDIAVDIIGIDIVNLSLNTNTDYRLFTIQTKEGKISTAYTKDSTKKYTNLKSYDKTALAVSDDRYVRLINKKTPITRIEKTREFKQSKNAKNIETLMQSQNPFGIEVNWIRPELEKVIFDGGKNNELWRSFIRGVSHSGLEEAVAILDEENKELFRAKFVKHKLNIFEFYNNTENWRANFQKSVLLSGLVKKCN